MKINSAEGNQSSRAGRSEGWTDANADRKLKATFFVAQVCFSSLTCALELKRMERSKKSQLVKNPKSTPKFMNVLYLKRLLCLVDLQGREQFI